MRPTLVAAPAFFFVSLCATLASATAQIPTRYLTARMATVVVTSPRAGDQLYIGRTAHITWRTPGSDASIVAIVLISANGRSQTLIAWSAPNTGSYNWTIPATQRAGNYTVHVRANEAEGRSGQFTISPIPAGVAVPNVSSFSPSDRGYINLTLTVNGRDFLPGLFTVRIGTQQLQLISQSTNVMVARLPATAVTGDLVVSHGTPATEYILKHAYRVSGDAVITDVQPRTIHRGTVVTVTGTDLWGAYPYNWTGSSGYVGLTNSTSVTAGDHMTMASTWDVSDDGTSATFTAYEMYTATALGGVTILNPQPVSVSGTFRLTKIGNNNNLLIAGPSVTWQPAVLAITSLVPPAWGTQAVNFVLVPFNGTLLVSVFGTDMQSAAAAMGNVGLRGAFSWSGNDGWIEVPYNALTNPVVLTKGAQTAQSPQPLTVIPSPRMQDPTTDLSIPLVIKIDQDVSLPGWDLAPAAGSGLSYPIRLTNSGLINCHLQFSVVSQTAGEIKIRFSTVTGSTVPPACLGASGSGKGQMVMYAELGGAQRELWRRSYYLTP
jgi:hypothetical protein